MQFKLISHIRILLTSSYIIYLFTLVLYILSFEFLKWKSQYINTYKSRKFRLLTCSCIFSSNNDFGGSNDDTLGWRNSTCLLRWFISTECFDSALLEVKFELKELVKDNGSCESVVPPIWRLFRFEAGRDDAALLDFCRANEGGALSFSYRWWPTRWLS